MSAVEPRVLIGASQLGWVTALTQWVSEHGGARLVGQALTPADIDHSAFDLLVLDGWSSLLSRRLVEETQGAGAAVLVLVNSERADVEASRLRDLGVSLSLPVSAAPEEIVGRAREVPQCDGLKEKARPRLTTVFRERHRMTTRSWSSSAMVAPQSFL